MKTMIAVVAAVTAFALPAVAIAAPSDPDPWFATDKALHFTACAVISGGAYGLTALATRSIPVRIAFGAGAGVAAGAGKELLNLAGLGHPSWKDFAWDLMGTFVGVGIAVTIDVATRGPDPGNGRAALTAQPSVAGVRF